METVDDNSSLRLPAHFHADDNAVWRSCHDDDGDGDGDGEGGCICVFILREAQV